MKKLQKAQRAALIAAMDTIAASKAAIAAELEAQAAAKATRMARSTRIRAGQFIKFQDATPEQQQTIRGLFTIKYWDCPNGSNGREVGLRSVCNPIMHWELGINWSRLYVCLDEDIIFVDRTTKKVNPKVDFGIHFYQGDREYVDIRIADLEEDR